MLGLMKVKKPAFSQLQIYKTLAWTFGVILLLILILFFARGWVRATVEPKTVQVFHGHSVQTTLDKQIRTLGDPLSSLKYINAKTQPSQCTLVRASSFRTEVDCTASVKAFGPVSSDTQTLRTNAAALQAKLDAAGWGGNPNMTLIQFINGITAGADNQPDATYTHYFGKDLCMLSTTTAFSKPKPPAMNTVFSCSRTFDLFGSPWPNLPAGSDGGSSPAFF
jgi:hypothetical protein